MKAKNRLVLKIGTAVVMGDDGKVATSRLDSILRDALLLKSQGWEILIVTSGAVGLGKKILKWPQKVTLEQKQICASVGQSHLMETYRSMLLSLDSNQNCGQILVTSEDFSFRTRYLTLKKMLESMLAKGIIPILNENDSLSVAELSSIRGGESFGDNDRLSAIVAAKLDANVLILLTNVDGIYSENPSKNAKARRISTVENVFNLSLIQSHGVSENGRGGMLSKIEASKWASLCGVTTLIGDGGRKFIVRDLVQRFLDPKTGNDVGTLILPQLKLTSSKRKWIGMASGYKGKLGVNQGAIDALRKNASLLPVGIVTVEGKFAAGDVVSIAEEGGVEIGRGVVSYSSQDLKKIVGLSSQRACEILGVKNAEAVHKNNLVVFPLLGK